MTVMPVAYRFIGAVAALEDPVRRALYELVSSRHPTPIGRDEAAAATGIGRSLAAFHLDRLVTVGLLQASFRRPDGRSGPGAGRPAKFYARSQETVEVSLPERDYVLAARLMLAALNHPGHSLEAVAMARGTQLGKAATGARSQQRKLEKLLARHGYEPVVEQSGNVRLRNCPFDALVAEGQVSVCQMNLKLLQGLLEGAGLTGFEARLVPEPGLCCVTLAHAQAPAP